MNADFNEIKNGYSSVMPTYARYDAAFARGEGSRLFDTDGKEYIDFSSGIGVNSVGYAHPEWVKAVAGQAAVLAHTSNLYYTLPAMELSQKMTKLSGMKNVFFANSGAEANEGMIKCARKYSRDKYGENRNVIVTLRNSFHGRTITTLAATGQDNFHRHFHPFTQGFVHCDMGDIEALSNMGEDVCAVMLELVQGEGGVLPCSTEYLYAVQKLCAERDWLFLVDEVQTGIGRLGDWFGFMLFGIKPDAVSFAKGIAGGLPLGGFMAGEKTEKTLGAGDHATTFGGNPVCCAAALATLGIISEVLDEVPAKGKYIKEKIGQMNLPCVKDVVGLGLMIGVSIDKPLRDTVEKLLSAGLVCLTAGKDRIRLLPPLTISYDDIDKGLEIFEKVLKD